MHSIKMPIWDILKLLALFLILRVKRIQGNKLTWKGGKICGNKDIKRRTENNTTWLRLAGIKSGLNEEGNNVYNFSFSAETFQNVS